MTLAIMLRCDGCGARLPGPCAGPTRMRGRYLRAESRADHGWVTVGACDYCPRCVPPSMRAGVERQPAQPAQPAQMDLQEMP